MIVPLNCETRVLSEANKCRTFSMIVSQWVGWLKVSATAETFQKQKVVSNGHPQPPTLFYPKKNCFNSSTFETFEGIKSSCNQLKS